MCLSGLDGRWKVLREVMNFSELWHKLEQKKTHFGWTQVQQLHYELDFRRTVPFPPARDKPQHARP